MVNGEVAVWPGRVWKPRYWVVETPVSAAGEMGYFVIPIQLSLFSWQLLQPLVMPMWTCAVLGTGAANFVPGAVSVAFPGTSPDGVEPR